MSEFDNLRDASIGSDIGDTVVVDGKQYIKTAGEGGVTSRMVPVETAASTNSTSATSGSTSSSGIGSKYLTDGIIQYKALNVNDLPSEAAVQAIRDSDRHTIQADGSITFKDEDGTEQYINNNYEDGVASVDFSNISSDVLQKAADVSYLAGNTGVKTTDMNAVYLSLGLDPNDNQASVKKDAILRAAGYNPGDNKTFYGNNTPQDIGAAAFYEQWQLAPEEGVVNDSSMNALWLSQKLGGNTASTAAYIRPNDLAATEEAQRQKTQNMYNQYVPGRSTDDELDIFEWGLKKKTDELKSGVTGGSGATGTVNTGGTGGVGSGMPSGTGSGTPYTGPNFVSTPNIGAVTPVYGDGQTGLTEVGIPTYEAGLNLQQQQFQQRAQDQQQFYKPQTLEEQQAAGTAPAFENVLYRNRFGMSMYVQHINGVPSQPIPPGYFRVQGFGTEAQTQGGSAAAAQGQNQGGVIQGYNGVTSGSLVCCANGYDPATGTYYYQNVAYDNANDYSAAVQAYNNPNGVETQTEEQNTTPQTADVNADFASGQQNVTGEDLAQYQRNLAAQAYAAPGGAVAAAPTSYIDPNAYGTVVESTAGQALGTAPMVTGDQVAQISSATTADTPQKIGAGQVDAQQAYSDVQNATADMTAATSTGPTQTITAAQDTGTSVSGLTAATGQATDVTNAPTRTEQTGEMITGTGVDQAKVGEAFGTGEVQAASVQGELANLMAQFEGGDTPAWAAGSMRAASQMLAARGLGASSMAGQAVIQAAMEAALPIAQIDAGNKQQMALFKAEQRAKFLGMEFDQAFQAKVMNAAKVSEIANMNFTAQQQIALENSRAANTMNLQNLSNKQALVLAEASALSGMDMTNLNNRQQAAVQNAQNFLQIDMANLSNEQQSTLFKQQSLINSILSDQAAANAAQQFNATSENQTNQFFANLSASVNQFNAAQINAMKQFNADEVNSLLEFNASIQNQREMFNAQNYLAVAQANAQWRQNLATINTAAANESNMDYAQTVNALTLKSLDEIWQRERDLMDYSFTSSENAADRALSILLGDKELQSIRTQLDSQEDQALGTLLTKVFFSSDFKSLFS